MKLLQPLILKDKYFAPLERQIDALFYDIIFKPVQEAFKENGKEYINAKKSALLEAIERGEIYFEGHLIKGNFEAATSKILIEMGAVYSPSLKGWTISNMLPEWQIAALDAKTRGDALRGDIIRNLDEADANQKILAANFAPNFEKSAEEADEFLRRTLRSITIEPRLTPEQLKIISVEWSNNLKLYIQKWAAEDIPKFRESVMNNTLAGKRADCLLNILQKQYNVSEAKAKFLARQETSLLFSQLRKARYKEAGLDKYVWIGVDDEKERPMHKALNNTIHSWDDPPVTNKEGDHNHPGEDYNCRCIATPILE